MPAHNRDQEFSRIIRRPSHVSNKDMRTLGNVTIYGLTTLAILSPVVCRRQSVISTVAGAGTCCADADGVSATLAHLQGADGLTIDSAGNLYIWESQPFRIRKVSVNGIISTVAGVNQSFGATGDGGPVTSALLAGSSTHSGLAMDSAGNLYISDTNKHRIRKVSTSGIITTVAGNGSFGFSGDNGPATSAMLNFPEGIAVDGAGNLYIADASNSRIRKVSPEGVITTVAGNGNVVDAICTLAPTMVAVLARMATCSNPLPVQLNVSGFERSITVTESQFVTVKLEGKTADALKAPT